MFIYKFKAKGNYLITYIVISGPHLTVYTRDEENFELLPIVQAVQLQQGFMGMEIAHALAHHPVFEFSVKPFDFEPPHQHHKFKSNDRFAELRAFCERMVRAQEDPLLQQQDFNSVVKLSETEMRRAGDQKLPSYLQKQLDAYCATCKNNNLLYLPANELTMLYMQFGMYLRGKSLPYFIELLATHAETFLAKNHNIISQEEMSHLFSKKDREIYDFYFNLYTLRRKLLSIHCTRRPQKAIEKAHVCISNLSESPYFNQELKHVLANIANFLNINSLPYIVESIYSYAEMFLDKDLYAAGRDIHEIYYFYNDLVQLQIALLSAHNEPTTSAVADIQKRFAEITNTHKFAIPMAIHLEQLLDDMKQEAETFEWFYSARKEANFYSKLIKNKKTAGALKQYLDSAITLSDVHLKNIALTDVIEALKNPSDTNLVCAIQQFLTEITRESEPSILNRLKFFSEALKNPQTGRYSESAIERNAIVLLQAIQEQISQPIPHYITEEEDTARKLRSFYKVSGL